jgi:hypothetical protein
MPGSLTGLIDSPARGGLRTSTSLTRHDGTWLGIIGPALGFDDARWIIVDCRSIGEEDGSCVDEWNETVFGNNDAPE